MASVGEVTVDVVPRVSPEFKELVTAAAGVEGDVIDKVNAGARLLYALYHSGEGTFAALPVPVLNAYMHASKVYGIEEEPSRG